MDEAAAAQAAVRMSAGDVDAALDTLYLLNGDGYMFGYDPAASPERPWWSMKDGKISSTRYGASPGELQEAIDGPAGDAAPQAAEDMTPGILEALHALDLAWGDEYGFGWDPEEGFWVRRTGAVEVLFTSADPRELGVFLADDIRARQ